MASRKPKVMWARVYVVTYKDSTSVFSAKVAAQTLIEAIAVFELTGYGAYSITNIQKTDEQVYHGVNC